MKEEARNRLDAALNMIVSVYQYVDAGACAEDTNLIRQTCQTLFDSGCTSRQAKRQVAREMFEGVSCENGTYRFDPAVGLERLSFMTPGQVHLAA